MSVKKKKWNDYLWIWTIVYFALGFFNIIFAWLGMIDFMLPCILLNHVWNNDFPDLSSRKWSFFFKRSSDTVLDI